MNVFPAISREMLAHARQPYTYTLRAIGVGLMLLAGLVFVAQYPFDPNFGGRLFQYLHFALFWSIWILVPLSAADCISRERRDGTLGLLFLTPLKARDIVVAKGVAHGLRAIMLLLAVLPVLTIPMLMGGVSWRQAALAALSNFNCLCWALGAALVASSGAKTSLRASVGAVVYSLCGFFIATILHGGTLIILADDIRSLESMSFGEIFEAGLSLMGVRGEFPADVSVISSAIWKLIFQSIGISTVISVVALLMAVVIAAWQIRRTWREEPPPIWVQKTQHTFCEPKIGVGLFKKWMHWKIDRNPIGWLEQRTWTGRLVTWAWFAIVISVYSAVLTDRGFFRGSDGFQMTIAWIMMGTIASSAAGSFRRERELGVLELLLVSPLSEEHIIKGRLFGLWGQFFPAVGMLLGVWLYFLGIFHQSTHHVFFFASTFFALPVIGLYFSLRCRSYIAAFLGTLFVGLLVPLLLDRVLSLIWGAYINSYRRFDAGFVLGYRTIFIQCLIATRLFFGLRQRLQQRSFPMEAGG